jgi:tetratricopeptide (TPR) repeat protein
MVLKQMADASLQTEGSVPGKLELPPAPATECGEVKVWTQGVAMLTYHPAAPDKNPLFLEKRVYQGSSGRVYPLAVIDSMEREPRLRTWEAIHLENEFVRLMILPEIGGRIHVGLDKSTGYDFFYRQNVIKPALVGLAGPWISGGVEFNWPQHHRPATFMPVETAIERGEDGSVTVWCSDHDPMARMKGMHGICLRPGKAVVEVKVRLYNRTSDTQTFLWWANVGTRVHEHYQSFFPKDVRFAADHAKRAITEYPLSQSVYYGIDYAERALHGVPADELPSKFIPDGSYAPNDLGWYANIPVPTSYMIVGSRGDFFGGYDHKRQAGTVAVSNHHIAPGKKQWTWGNHEFGYAWDRSLTDSDGPYVELMSGAYTDNQPDFSFLAPGETKTFSQYWYPIAEIGVPDLANLQAALRVERMGPSIAVHVQATAELRGCSVSVRVGEEEAGSWTGDLLPERPLHLTFPANGSEEPIVVFLTQQGRTLLRYAPGEIARAEVPVAATEPPLPADVESNDELYLTGLHLEQYRHPTRAADGYWREALRRDPGDSRANHALGRWHLRRGEFVLAERHLRGAIARLTARNPNPYDGEPHYNLGLTLLYLERRSEAYDAFYKSAWNAAWRAPAYLRLAELDCGRSEWEPALDHLNRSLCAECDNLNARCLKAVVLQRLGRAQESLALLGETHALDPLDIFSRFLLSSDLPKDTQQRLDLAFDLVRAGLFEEALRVVSQPAADTKGAGALLGYFRADILARLGRSQESEQARLQAAMQPPDYVFPNRLEELVLLEEAITANPGDGYAAYYLGNFLYDRRRYEEAITQWERATELLPEFATSWRNLGFAYQNVRHDAARAVEAFARASRLAPEDARILYEHDQLLKRTGACPPQRLKRLEEHRDLVERRDDLSQAMASLYNSQGQPHEALRILLGRQFQPWEGGEGLVLGEYVRANVLEALQALNEGKPERALRDLQAASQPPHNLSEAKHLLMNLSMIDYWLGVAHARTGEKEQANASWDRAARQRGDFQQMQVYPISETTFWSAMALRRLGREIEASRLFAQILEYARALRGQTPKIDYFATSLPAMLLFEEDLEVRQAATAQFLEAQAAIGLGRRDDAAKLLGQVLQMDRDHTGAIDLSRALSSDLCKEL